MLDIITQIKMRKSRLESWGHLLTVSSWAEFYLGLML